MRLILTWIIGPDGPDDQLEEQVGPQFQHQREAKFKQPSEQRPEQQRETLPLRRARRRVLPSSENDRPLDRQLWL